MALKIAILVVFVLMLISLGSGLYFLLNEKGKGNATLHSLGVRVTLAILLILLLTYGFISGQLESQAPWARPSAPPTTTEGNTP